MTFASGQTSHGAGAPGPEIDALIDAYLDGAMSDQERAAFEARAQSDEAVARELALQRAADESLRRQFRPPAVPMNLPTRAVQDTGEVAGRIDRTSGGAGGGGGAGAGDGADRPRRRVISTPLAAAALILLAVVVGYFAMNGLPFGGGGGSHATAQAVYKQVVDGGFKPQWVCESDEQFAQYTKDRFGAPWQVDQDKGVTLVGWRYSADLLGPDESLLLATKDGQKIVVVADAAANARRVRGGDGLKVHTRETNGLVMYEISPLDDAVIINHITVGEKR